MNTNVLNAFANIVESSRTTVNPAEISSNRINNQGDALEGYVKDAFTGLLNVEMTDSERDKNYSKHFSWLGNASNIPDSILRGGDAIEVKKLESLGTTQLQLNSSHPHKKLRASDSRISQAARDAERWIEKDIIYTIGTINGGSLKRLWFIYGDCYAAEEERYTRVTDAISSGTMEIPDIEFNKETNEIARVNKVDPLGITDLRVRGMWLIMNPSKLYSELVRKTEERQFYLLMRETKYQSFPEAQRNKMECIDKKGYNNRMVKIRNPDNPAKQISARFISYEL